MAHFVSYDTPKEKAEEEEEIARLRSREIGDRMTRAFYRLEAALRKANFNPNQPRVPAGHGDESGEWTRVPGWTQAPRAGGGRRLGDDRTARPRIIPAADRVPASQPGAARSQTPGATGGAARDPARTRPPIGVSAPDIAAMRDLFREAMEQLVASKLLTPQEASRFTFDPRYAAFKYFRNRDGADEILPDTGKFFATKEELYEYVERFRLSRYVPALGHTTHSKYIFFKPTSVIFGGAAHAGHMEGFMQPFSAPLMMRFAIMHEHAHQRGIRSEDKASAYAARRLDIRNLPPGSR